jgi:hypothetical protein
MNERDANFEPLCRLLALKKFEVPPPGYFNNFSDQVITQIRLGESVKDSSWLTRLFVEAPWLLKFFRMFEAKPAYAGTFASVLFLFLVAGIVYSDYSDHPETTAENFLPAGATTAAPGGSSLLTVTPAFLGQSTSQSSGLVSGTNPVSSFDSGGSPFGGQNPPLQTVGFTR